MKVSRVKLLHFRRFTDLEITGIPEGAKLVVMAGPNGCGKSSLFDAFSLAYQRYGGYGVSDDGIYWWKTKNNRDQNQVKVEFHNGAQISRGSMYFRSAYRNDPEFALGNLQRLGKPEDEIRLRRMIENDSNVSQNYQRLAATALAGLFAPKDGTISIDTFTSNLLDAIRKPLGRVFSDLHLNGLGDPLSEGTFKFDKGISKAVDYKNLSGGEKASFDLILDIAVKRDAYPNAIYCIDEPETHMNTRLQAALLQELYDLVPDEGQLWISTHSIGMMRKAREMYVQNPQAVVFLDFDQHDFDQPVIITPSAPNRDFWERALSVALDDLASLVAPRQIILCEGNPIGIIPGKNAEQDARCYNAIFAEEYPDTKFVAAGNASDVNSNRFGFLTAIPELARGINVSRLIDRDDHSDADRNNFISNGTRVLGRRHLECYLYDDEILEALCVQQGQPNAWPQLLADKQAAIASLAARSKPADDIKSAAPQIYVAAKHRLGLTQVGNDAAAFARNILTPLLKPGTNVYGELKRDIFGP